MIPEISFQATAGLGIEFLNFLSQNNIQLWDISCTPLGFTAKCYGADYFFIASNCRKFQVKVRIIEKRGIIFKILKLKKRKGIVVAILMFFVMNIIFSNIVWKININTKDSLLENEIAGQLLQQNIYAGCFYSEDKINLAIKNIMIENRELGYMTLNFYKGVLDCNLYQRTDREDYIYNLTGNNIYAQKTGIITDLRVYDGFSALSIGQVVSQGDILVSNVYTDKYGNIYTSDTRAYIEALCEEKYTVYVPFSKSAQLLTGNSEKKSTLYYPGGKKDIADANVEDWENCVKKEKMEYLTVFGLHLPLTLVTVTYYQVEEKDIKNDILSALNTAKLQIEHMVKNDEKLKDEQSRIYQYSIDEEGIMVVAAVKGIYDIT